MERCEIMGCRINLKLYEKGLRLYYFEHKYLDSVVNKNKRPAETL